MCHFAVGCMHGDNCSPQPHCLNTDMHLPALSCCRWSLGVTLWQMVAGNLPAWAEEQQHHHHHHHIHGRSQQEQQQGTGSAARQEQDAASSSCSQSSDDSLVLPLEPAATHCHTTPKDLQFPPQFSKVSWLWQMHPVRTLRLLQ